MTMEKLLHEYNWELCQSRHKEIEADMKEVKHEISKVSNRFLVLLTMLSMNLLGVAATLFYLLIK